MKITLIAIGAGIGYLAGNERARRMAFDKVKQIKSSPRTKALEEKVTDKVTNLTSRADRELDVTDPSYVGDADSVDTGAYTPTHLSSR